MNEIFIGDLKNFIVKAINGSKYDIDYILNNLNDESSIATTRYIDYALSLVTNDEGINRIEYYLFHGTLIQRNYCCLFFCRRWDYDIVDKAYRKGLIDEIQAFAR